MQISENFLKSKSDLHFALINEIFKTNALKNITSEVTLKALPTFENSTIYIYKKTLCLALMNLHKLYSEFHSLVKTSVLEECSEAWSDPGLCLDPHSSYLFFNNISLHQLLVNVHADSQWPQTQPLCSLTGRNVSLVVLGYAE